MKALEEICGNLAPIPLEAEQFTEHHHERPTTRTAGEPQEK